MNGIYHLMINFLFGLTLYFSGVIDSIGLFLFFILMAVIIDIDHILFFITRHRTLSIKKMYSLHKSYNNSKHANLYVFHSPEVNLVLLFLGLFNEIVFLVFVSNLLHIIADTISHLIFHGNFKFMKEWSIFAKLFLP
ncbi:hypothetical protein ACFLZX_03490 [Nanoarchaeota archaeon]